MEPLYRVGDKVLIKSKYDPGCNSNDYRFGFIVFMKKNYGGQVCTISEISATNLPNTPNMIFDDCCRYRLKEDKENWSWASSMFEPEF